MNGFEALDVSRLAPGDEDLWRELATRAAEANPFYEPDFVLPAHELLGGPRIELLIVRRDGAWDACLPVVRQRWHGALPAICGWRGPYAFLGTPLVARDRFVPALASLITGALELTRSRPLVIERANADGPLVPALRGLEESGAIAVPARIDSERAILNRREEDDYLSHLKSHHRREMNRQGRRFAEAEGELRCEDRAGQPAAVENFVRVERSGWKGHSGTAFGSEPSHARFFEEVCARFARAGRLQMLELRAGNRHAASKCNLIAGDGAFAFKIGFSQELARYSPGIQLELQNLRYFADSDLMWMDSCAEADNQMINRLWPDRRRLCTVVLSRTGLTGTALRTALAPALRARERRRRRNP